MPHTHDVTLGAEIVRKRYVAWDQGEPEREWTALHLLAREAPGLAPEPVGREVEGGRPVVVMSRVPGAPLRGPVTRAQTRALADALLRLFAVPVPDGLAERVNGPSVMRSDLAAWAAEPVGLGPCRDPDLVRGAVDRARDWLGGGAPVVEAITEPVLALGDGNLDNVLWDGQTCRLVDWEEFGVSDLAYEVADVVEHASSRLAGTLDTETLLDHLGLDDTRRARAEAYRRLFACLWLLMLLPGNGGFSRNPPGSTEAQAAHLVSLLDR